MADIKTKEQRSKNMAAIKGKGTKPEEIVRKYLFSKGFRYRKNVKHLPGTPDIVLPKYRTVIFVNGCFWHHHEGCKYAVIPATRQEFWNNKLARNVERDKKVTEALEKGGWHVLTVWECELKTVQIRDRRLEKLIDEVKEINT